MAVRGKDRCYRTITSVDLDALCLRRYVWVSVVVCTSAVQGEIAGGR